MQYLKIYVCKKAIKVYQHFTFNTVLNADKNAFINKDLKKPIEELVY